MPPRKHHTARSAVLGVVVIVAGLVMFFGVRALFHTTSTYISSWTTPSVGTSDAVDGSVSGPVAPTLDYSGFTAGHIIDDEDFYNGNAMTASDVASFIEAWNTGCVSQGDAAPCLADFVMDTETIDRDAYCGGYTGATGETAADIISQVATSCNISAAVLLVTLQKEQGLVTASGSSLTEFDYVAAMGYACPDSGSCDATYAGFQRQVYYAARQFQRYRMNAEEYSIRAAADNVISFAPDATCGARSIYIANQATASLYLYTPYQPNQAAVSGSSDECSAYGNLNFYAYWQAWFAGGVRTR